MFGRLMNVFKGFLALFVKDMEKKNPEARNRGHTVVKFSPEGKVLLTIGKPGVAGHPPEALTEPTSIVELANGDFLISEGHSGAGVRLDYERTSPEALGATMLEYLGKPVHSAEVPVDGTDRAARLIADLL